MVPGPLTLLPILQGNPLDWSYTRGSALFGSLVGHVIYGVLLGMVYAALDWLWIGFFIESDPINREVEGPGTTTLRALGWGAVASLAGGLLFSLVMVATGALPRVAGDGRIVAGAGLRGSSGDQRADRDELWGAVSARSAEYGVGRCLGLLYGLVWWFLGPLTLLPILLGSFTVDTAAVRRCPR